MYSPESKKLALTRIKEIFETYSDLEHPLTQNDIAEHLDHDYGINIDRKTIGRNISLLKETGIEIESDHRGSYLGSRLFEDSELRMLIDGILCSKYITAKHSEDLIKRICGLSNIYFRSHIKNIFSVTDRCKTENPSLFYNIEVIDEQVRSRQAAAQIRRAHRLALSADSSQPALLSHGAQRAMAEYSLLSPGSHNKHADYRPTHDPAQEHKGIRERH